MLKTTRDLTETQFARQLEKHGMEHLGFLGYVDVGRGLSICKFNAGNNRRAQLAYLLKEQERDLARRDAALEAVRIAYAD